MSYAQIFEIIRLCHEDNAQEAIQRLMRGNDTAGGMVVDPHKYYLFSTYGRVACVADTGEMKLVGSINKDQYIKVQLNCIDQTTPTREQRIQFPLADLILKNFKSLDGEPMDMVKFVTDHRNFLRRDNHIMSLWLNTWVGNCKRKKSNTQLVSKLCHFIH